MRRWVAFALVLCGCGPDVVADADGGTEGDDTEEEPGADDDDDAPPPPDVPEDDAVCGNAVIESLEECDDGNLTPGDGCEADCQHTSGTLLWEYAAPAGFGFGLTQAVDAEGDLFVAGTRLDSMQDQRWTAKLDRNGVVQWTATEPIGKAIWPRAILPIADGGVIVTSEERIDPEVEGDGIIWHYFWAQFDASGVEVERIMDPEIHRSASPPPFIGDGEGGYYTAYRTYPDEELYIEHWSAFGEVLTSERVLPPRDEPIGAYALGLLDDGRLLMVGFERDMESPEGELCAADGWGKSDRYAAIIDDTGEIHAETVLDDDVACVESFGSVTAFAGGWVVQGGRTYATFEHDGTFVAEHGSPEIDGVEDFAVWEVAVDSQGRLVLAGGDGYPSWMGVDGVVAAYDADGLPRFTEVMEGHESELSDWGGTRIREVTIAPNDDVIVSGYRTLPDGLEAELFIRRYAD